MAMLHRSPREFAALLVMACCMSGAIVGEAQVANSGDRNLEVERSVYQGLARPLNRNLRGLAFGSALREIGGTCGIEFAIDQKAFTEAAIPEDFEIEVTTPPASAEVVLATVLRPWDLTWVVRDGQPTITTVAQADTELDARVYPVKDLVLARDQQGEFADFDSLVEVITGTIAPTTWADVGGAGGIKQYFNSQSLVIAQTREVHRDIEKLLAGLRDARDRQGLSTSLSTTRSSARVPATVTYAVPSPSVALPIASIFPSANHRSAAPSPVSRLVRTYE
jgi:hypothetical protein